MIKFPEKTAPTCTPESIEAVISAKQFYVFPGTTLTVCLLTLQNGFTVTGESACASPENFNKEEGEHYSFEKAKNKIWMLEGYLLKHLLHTSSVTVD
jgi:hypothetical protein